MMRSRPNPTPMRLGRGAAGLGLALALTGSALAAPPAEQATLKSAVTQPLRDLNLMRTKVAPPLQSARSAPYDIAGLKACDEIRAQIGQLDQALGPDVDEDQAQPGVVKTLAASAVRSAVKLPFSGVVRRLSGADAKERVRQQSVQAGMARRAFLKGVALTRCNPDGGAPDLDIAATAPATEVAAAGPTVELRPPLTAEPPRVQVAAAASNDAMPIDPQDDHATPPPREAHEPIYVWVASDPGTPGESGGR
jgi:hypothetical protein